MLNMVALGTEIDGLSNLLPVGHLCLIKKYDSFCVYLFKFVGMERKDLWASFLPLVEKIHLLCIRR